MRCPHETLLPEPEKAHGKAQIAVRCWKRMRCQELPDRSDVQNVETCEVGGRGRSHTADDAFFNGEVIGSE